MVYYNSKTSANELLTHLDQGWKKNDLLMIVNKNMIRKPQESGFETTCHVGLLSKYENGEPCRLTLDRCILIRPAVDVSGPGLQANIEWSNETEIYTPKRLERISAWKLGPKDIAQYLEATPGFEIYAPLIRALEKKYTITNHPLEQPKILPAFSKHNNGTKPLINI
jgi:hypothetical protein